MTTLKLNSKGQEVYELQNFLRIKTDGIFGQKTKKAVMQFQTSNKLFPDGIVGPKTYQKLFDKGFLEQNRETIDSFDIDFYRLPEYAYFKPARPKKWIFLHHTNGWHNPYKVIDDWAQRQKNIGTEYVIGGQSIENNDAQYDGKILQSKPDNHSAWHLGIGNNSMHLESLGIELCNFGYVTKGYFLKKENGIYLKKLLDSQKYYTTYGNEVNENQLVKLSEPFRNFSLWHKYSDAQIKSLKNLLEFQAYKQNIDIRAGLPNLIRKIGTKAFDKTDIKMCKETPGLWSHTNVSKVKVDVAPQENMIEMLLSL